MTTYVDDAPDRGRQVHVDAEAALRARNALDPEIAARQPTEAELRELAAMDAAEAASDAQLADVAAELNDALSGPEPVELPLGRLGAMFTYRPPQDGAVAAAKQDARMERIRQLKDRREHLADDQMALRATNNTRRAAISTAGTQRALKLKAGKRR